MVDEGRTVQPETLFFGHDVDVGNEPVRVFADERVVVTAATNTHFPERFVARMQHRSLGYRFETSTRSICFSGDTAYSANIVRLARGADVFVCEVMDHRTYENNMARAKEAADAGNPESVFRHVAETHSTPSDVGRMAQRGRRQDRRAESPAARHRGAGLHDLVVHRRRARRHSTATSSSAKTSS